MYKIIKNRIQKKGYSREVFDYKCSTVCQLTQAIYIASRYRMYNDILYFIKSRKNKKISFIHEDEELEKKLNKLDFSKISDGEIIHEFKK